MFVNIYSNSKWVPLEPLCRLLEFRLDSFNITLLHMMQFICSSFGQVLSYACACLWFSFFQLKFSLV